MRIFLAITLAVLILVPSLALAKINPQMTSDMRVEVNQDVQVALGGDINTLEVKLMMPQEDDFQRIELLDVSMPYEIVTDDYENRMIKVIFDKPRTSVTFNVKSIVLVSRRNSASLPQLSAFTTPTNLIQSDDKEIINLAETLTTGETGDFERAAVITDWVNKNIKYDLTYAEVNLSAKRTLQQKAGVCDEYSALTMAMLRGIGYRTAYIVGYAYGRGYRIAEDFVPHGWVEACSPSGECYTIDPTWGETGWLDAAHIKFATLPESYYVEATGGATGTGKISINLESVDTKIKILDITEKPLVTADSRLLDDNVWKDYAVLRTDLEAPGCVLTKVIYGSCLKEDGEPFLEPEQDEMNVFFCGERTLFMPFKIPGDIGENTVYTCSVTAVPSAGRPQEAEVTISPKERSTDIPALIVDRTAVKTGETVIASASGSEIFTDYGTYGAGEISLSAPAKSFKVYAYKNGKMSFQDISVTETRPLDIELTAPESMKLGEETNISIDIKNIDAASREVSVRIVEDTQSKKISAGKSEIFVFSFVPSEDDKIVQAFVESEGFTTSTSESINVIMPEKSIIEQIMDAITNFIESILVV